MEKVKFNKKTFKINESTALILPPQLQEFIGIQMGDEVELCGECKSKGKFIAIWKKDTKEE